MKRLLELFKKKAVKEEEEKKLFIIDVLSSHRLRYVVECSEPELDNIVSFDDTNELTEFSQEHLGEKIVSYHTLKGKEEYLKTFAEDNSYLKEWSEEQKLQFINRK